MRNQEFSPILSTTADEYIVDGAVDVAFVEFNLDTGLTWENKINNVCSKTASGILGLRKLSFFCSPQIHSKFMPNISSFELWSYVLNSCAHKHYNRVLVLQKTAIRILGKMNNNYTDSCRETFKSTVWAF